MGPGILHKHCTCDTPGHTRCTASEGRADGKGTLHMQYVLLQINRHTIRR